MVHIEVIDNIIYLICLWGTFFIIKKHQEYFAKKYDGIYRDFQQFSHHSLQLSYSRHPMLYSTEMWSIVMYNPDRKI